MYLHRYLITFTTQEALELHGYPQNIFRAAMLQSIDNIDPKLYALLTQPGISRELRLSGNIHGSPPAPYLLSQVYSDFNFRKGEKLQFILTLFGFFHQYEESFIGALKKCCSVAEDPAIAKFEFSGYEKLYCPLSGNACFELKDYLDLDPKTQNLVLHFTTPVNMKHKDKKASQDFSFDMIYNNFLLTRISNLSKIYCNDDPGLNEIYIDRVKTVDIVASRRMVRGKNYGAEGWLGRIIYSGDFKEIFGILKYGEYIHIGSDTHKGIGSYEVKLII